MKSIIRLSTITIFALTSCNQQSTSSKLATDTITKDTVVKTDQKLSTSIDTVANKLNTNSQPTVDYKKEFCKLTDFLKKFEDPSQIFKISSSVTTIVTGKMGTRIHINPLDLETQNGKAFGEEINVELKELINTNQLLTANAQTLSNGKLLVSGGAYYINMTSNKQTIKLKKGKTLKVEFPVINNNTDMSLFYGKRDSLNQIDWQQSTTKEKFEQNTLKSNSEISEQTGKGTWNDPYIAETKDIDVNMAIKEKLTNEEKQILKDEAESRRKLYKAMNLTSFGWINCDRFNNMPTTNLIVKFNPKDDAIYLNSYLVFKNINSLIENIYFKSRTNINSSGFAFSNVPIGTKATLISYTLRGKKTYAYSKDIIINANETILLALKEVDEKDFKKLINSN